MDYLTRFEELINDLESNPLIKLTKAKISPPAKQEDLIWLTDKVNNVPEPVLNFYQETNGIVIKWKTDPEQKEIKVPGGLIEILPLKETFKDWKEEIWFESDPDSFFRWVKPFDFFTDEACSAVIVDKNKTLGSTVYYHYLGESLEDTKYSFTEYIDRLIASKGAFYWIESLCAATCNRPQTQAFLSSMPLLFKGFDQALFKPKA